MAKSIKINGVTYADVEKLEIPLADDSSKKAVFPETSDASAVAASVKNGETFYADGEKHEGTMPVNKAETVEFSDIDDSYDVPEGYHDGTGSVKISDTEKAKLVPANIRAGISVLGVEGSMSTTEGANPQAKEVTPTESEQVVLPDDGYNYLSQVTVKPIPDEYITTSDADAAAENIQKDKTAYVNGVKITGTHTDPTFTLANGVLSIA